MNALKIRLQAALQDAPVDLDFSNITSFSLKAQSEIRSRISKGSYLFGVVETHKLLPSDFKGLSLLEKVVGTAEPSTESISGSYGGTAIFVPHSLHWEPLSGAEGKQPEKLKAGCVTCHWLAKSPLQQ